MAKTKGRSYFSRYGSLLKNEFRGYNGKKFLKDMIAGFTVGAVALPLALAFGASSVDPAHAEIGIAAGLITAIIAGLVTGLLGGGSFQISGPTGAMSVVLIGIVAGKYGLQGMFIACFMSGIILVLAGLLKLGKLVDFIPKPVVAGFTTGIALVIAIGQLGNFFGVTVTGSTSIEKLQNFISVAPQINWITTVLSISVVAIMVLFPRKLNKIIPGSLVAMILLTAVVAIFKIQAPTIGEIPASIINSEVLNIDAVTPSMLLELCVPALTIALLCMIETLLCGVCASNMKKEPFDSDVELVAQGVGKIVVPFLGGVPSTSAIARTSVAIKSGSQTRLTSVFHSLFLLLCVFLLAPAIGLVPYASLAGVLMVTAFNMNDWKSIKHYFKRKSWASILLFLVTMVTTVVLDLIYAILIGVGVSLVIILVNLSTVEVYSELKQDLRTISSNVSGPIFYASVNDYIRKVKQINCDYDRIILNLDNVTYIDTSALEVMLDFFKELNETKVVVFMVSKNKVLKTIARDGFYQTFGAENFYSDFESAYNAPYVKRNVVEESHEIPDNAEIVAEVASANAEEQNEFAKPLTTATEKSADGVKVVIPPPSE